METLAFSHDIKILYNFNFTHDTSRELKYHVSDEVKAFMRKAAKMVKRSDMGVYEQPFKRKQNNES